MSNVLNIPFCSPLKFYEDTTTPGIHFDHDWTYERIKNFETKKFYYQKWQRGDTTKLQVGCSFLPDNLKLYNSKGKLKKSFPFTLIAAGGSIGYSIYECEIDIDDQDDDIYFFYFKATFIDVSFAAISEPVQLKDSFQNTLIFQYWNSFNDHGVIFSTGIKYKFRCEAGIMDMQPDRERASYTDLIHNIATLSATAFRTYKLYVGEAAGVAPYVLDIMNRIFCCDNVLISKDGNKPVRFETTEGSKWDINRVKGYPLFGGSIEIIEAINKSSLQITDDDSVVTGIITGYNLDTNFFGTGGTNRAVTEIENN